ncbi:MAG TPA: hypothetical protein ENN43_07265 [bacterium]|nr:hypothetical protein [bacterium]
MKKVLIAAGITVLVVFLFSCKKSEPSAPETRVPDTPTLTATPENTGTGTFTPTAIQTFTATPTDTPEATATNSPTITPTHTVTGTPYYGIQARIVNEQGQPKYEVVVLKNGGPFTEADVVITDQTQAKTYTVPHVWEGTYTRAGTAGAEYIVGNTYIVEVSLDGKIFSDTGIAPGGNINVTDMDLMNGIYCTWDTDGSDTQINLWKGSGVVYIFYMPISGEGQGYNIPVSIFEGYGSGTYSPWVFVRNFKNSFDTLTENSSITIHDWYIKEVHYNP